MLSALIATTLPGASALASSAAAASSTTACLAGSPSSRISRAIERGGSRASSRPPPPLTLRPPLAVMGAHSAEGPRCAFAPAPLIAAHSRFDSWEEFAHSLDDLETGDFLDASFVAGHDLELGLHR